MTELHNRLPLAAEPESGADSVLPAAAPLTRRTTRMMPDNTILDREPSRDSARH